MPNPEHADCLIIGGGVAGTTAAETLRARSDQSIAIVTDDRHCLYSRVRLPDYVSGAVPREKVFIREESWYREKNIRLLKESTVRALSPTDRSVQLDNGSAIRYETLLIAAGGSLRRLSCDGSGLEGIHYLRTIEDADRMIRDMESARRALVVGGSFIGLELARCFARKGLEATMVMMEPRFWPNILDPESSAMIDKALTDQGVTIHYNVALGEIRGNGRVSRATFKDGRGVDCDILGVGIGIDTVRPFIKESGIEVHRGVVTDEFLRTSDPHIYAAGDISEFYDRSRAGRNQVGNWTNAAEQGKAAALNMAGERIPFGAVSGYTIRLFGLSIGFAGDTALLPGTEVIARGTPPDGSAVRLLIRDGVVKGATVINRPHEMRPIMGLIKDAVRVDGFKSDLADPGRGLDERR